MNESSGAVDLACSARHRVRNGVENMILRGEVQSGTKLKQIRLAQQFGVGQGVVREALIELQAMGLVESVDNRGVYVTQINAVKLIDALEVRAAIEGMAVRLCCDRCSRSDQRKLQEMVDDILKLFEAGSKEEGASLDREFHHELVRLSMNGELLRVTNSYRAFGKVVQLNRDPEVVYAEHCAILTAIGRGDPDDAERTARDHLVMAKNTLEERLRSNPLFVPNIVT